MEQLPEFLLADSTEHPESIFVIHTVFPRFVINLQNDEIEWWESFTAEDKEIAMQEVAHWVEKSFSILRSTNIIIPVIQLDEQLFLYLNAFGSESWDGFWLFMTDKFNMIPLYVVLLIYTFRHIGWKKGLWFVFTIALLITCTDQITNLFKDGFARLRPCHDPDIAPLMRLVKDRCGGLYGFFSGHSSNSFALAIFFITFFKSIYPAMRWLVLWAAIVAYSRVYVGVHYPIDILCGALFGSAIGFVFARTSRRYLLP